MTWSDPIVDEVRRVRDAYAARFNYDLRAIYRDLKNQEKRSGRKIVSYAESSTEVEPDKALQPIGPVPTVSENGPSQKAGPVTDLCRSDLEE
jgi:hypothetical protein